MIGLLNYFCVLLLIISKNITYDFRFIWDKINQLYSAKLKKIIGSGELHLEQKRLNLWKIRWNEYFYKLNSCMNVELDLSNKMSIILQWMVTIVSVINAVTTYLLWYSSMFVLPLWYHDS